MQFTEPLPMPPEDALVHCNQLIHTIKAEIEQGPNGISFRRFMEMALYEPSLGYYVAGMRKIGKSGDFVTAPEISPLFSHCLAQSMSASITKLNPRQYFRIGGRFRHYGSRYVAALRSLALLTRILLYS